MPDASPVKVASGAYQLVLRDRDPGAARPATSRSIRASPICSIPITRRSARAIRGPRRGLLTRPGLDEVMAYRAHVDAAMARGLRAMPRWRDADRPGPASRAAASGIDPHRHQARLLLQSAAAGLSRAKPAPRTPQPLDWLSPFRAASSQIGHDGSGFSFDNESAAPSGAAAPVPHRLAAPSAMANITPSSPMAAIAAPNSGCPTAGPGCRRKAGRRRSIG